MKFISLAALCLFASSALADEVVTLNGGFLIMKCEAGGCEIHGPVVSNFDVTLKSEEDSENLSGTHLLELEYSGFKYSTLVEINKFQSAGVTPYYLIVSDYEAHKIGSEPGMLKMKGGSSLTNISQLDHNYYTGDIERDGNATYLAYALIGPANAKFSSEIVKKAFRKK